MDTWLIIETPNGPYCWDLGQPDDQTRETLVNAARLAVGVPPNESWVDDQSFAVTITFGEPHPQLMARATVGLPGSLANADPVAVQAYSDARATAQRQKQIDGVREAYLALDPSAQAAVTAPAGPQAAQIPAVTP